MSTDWYPKTQAMQLMMAKRWCEILPGKAAAWKIPLDDIDILSDLTGDAERLFNLVHSDKATKGDGERMREAFKLKEAKMRDMKARHFFIPPLDRGAFVDLYLDPPSDGRTEHHIVTEEIEYTIEIMGIRMVHLHFKVRGAKNKAKPTGYDGAVVTWAVLDKPPTDPKELTNHTLASRTPHTVHFEEHERGKTAYFALRWQNERGNLGPLSEILSAIIP